MPDSFTKLLVEPLKAMGGVAKKINLEWLKMIESELIDMSPKIMGGSTQDGSVTAQNELRKQQIYYMNVNTRGGHNYVQNITTNEERARPINLTNNKITFGSKATRIRFNRDNRAFSDYSGVFYVGDYIGQGGATRFQATGEVILMEVGTEVTLNGVLITDVFKTCKTLMAGYFTQDQNGVNYYNVMEMPIFTLTNLPTLKVEGMDYKVELSIDHIEKDSMNSSFSWDASGGMSYKNDRFDMNYNFSNEGEVVRQREEERKLSGHIKCSVNAINDTYDAPGYTKLINETGWKNPNAGPVRPVAQDVLYTWGDTQSTNNTV